MTTLARITKTTPFSIALLTIITSLGMGLSSCSKTPSSNAGNAAELTATMHESSKSLGLIGGVSENASSEAAGQDNQGPSNFSLVQIDTSANVESAVKNVLSRDSLVYFIATTSSSIVASGIFLDAQWDDGVYSCYLIRFSKQARGERVKCLSKTPIGNFIPDIGLSNAHHSKIGIKQRGNTIFFVTSDSLYVTTNLYKWSDGDNSATLLLSKPYQGMGFSDIFLDNSGANICVLAPAISSNSVIFVGQMLCGTESSTSWSDISDSLTNPYILAETFQFNNLVVAPEVVIDMATLSISSRNYEGDNSGLPSGYGNRVSTSDGGLIARAYAGSLSHISPNGDNNLIANHATSSKYWFKILKSGNYAWVYGGNDLNDESNGNSLRRIDLSNQSFESTAYFSQTGLVAISDLLYHLDGNTIIVEGVDQTGEKAFAKISPDGSVSPLPSLESNLFLSVIDL